MTRIREYIMNKDYQFFALLMFVVAFVFAGVLTFFPISSFESLEPTAYSLEFQGSAKKLGIKLEEPCQYSRDSGQPPCLYNEQALTRDQVSLALAEASRCVIDTLRRLNEGHEVITLGHLVQAKIDCE